MSVSKPPPQAMKQPYSEQLQGHSRYCIRHFWEDNTEKLRMQLEWSQSGQALIKHTGPSHATPWLLYTLQYGMSTLNKILSLHLKIKVNFT